ncbi:PAM17 Presequence translocated-associated motor subunit PAM17 [Candida maltosa Xu316]
MFTKRSLFRSLRFNSSTTQPKLTWVDYFQLKKQNNRLNTIAGVFTGIGGSFITLTYLGNIEIDVEKPIMGFDPLMVMGGAVMLGGLVGYLLGPFLGSYVFRLSNKAKLTEFELKNSQFLSRLKVKRPDPSKQSFSNPIPDYYGEKIYSLKDYKQWLRDCNAFKRKSKEFL